MPVLITGTFSYMHKTDIFGIPLRCDLPNYKCSPHTRVGDSNTSRQDFSDRIATSPWDIFNLYYTAFGSFFCESSPILSVHGDKAAKPASAWSTDFTPALL